MKKREAAELAAIVGSVRLALDVIGGYLKVLGSYMEDILDMAKKEEQQPVKGFLSEAQREKFKQLVAEGKIAQDHFDAKERVTAKKIPRRIHPPKKEKK